MSVPGRWPQTAVCLSCGAVYWVAEGHACGCGPSRVRVFLTGIAGYLTALAPWLSPCRHSRRCGCPLCSRSERQVRMKIGMPVGHPEWITRELADEQEELLALLAGETWPEDEYASIVAEYLGDRKRES